MYTLVLCNPECVCGPRANSPSQNISHRLQSPTTAVISWGPPLPQYSNGYITHYGYQFHKSTDVTALEKNTTHSRIVISERGRPLEHQAGSRDPRGRAPSPTNVQAMATSDQSVEVWWDEVPYFHDILGYQVLYTQTPEEDLDSWKVKQVPLTWSAELEGLESHSMYAVRVAAILSNQGLGRLSDLITVKVTPTDVPTQLRAQAVTTHSMILSWRRPSKLDPLKYKISYGAHKEFYDSQGALQRLPLPPVEVFVDSERTEYSIDSLFPFTSYQVNITAVPPDESPRPAAKMIVTTAMAAPKPMVKPDSFGVQPGNQISVILPKASEEYGPISHYFLAVVPEEIFTKDPDHYQLEELTETPLEQVGPYIAAKFQRRAMPDSFPLGDGNPYMGFVNRRLLPDQKYRIFVRAVVDTPQKSLFTNSPFSDPLSLEMVVAPGQAPPLESGAGQRTDGPDVAHVEGSTHHGNGSLVLVACGGPYPIVCGDPGRLHSPKRKQGEGNPWSSKVSCLFVMMMRAFMGLEKILGCQRICGSSRRRALLSKLPRRRQQLGKGAGGETTMKLLLNVAAPTEPTPHPNDPVELRRMNYQTPGMLSHPPIPVTELAAHIDRLKANDNLKFSQEYESRILWVQSIDPGQQFTWENSNLEINKTKNRYANVIAYDHSRVVLQSVDGISGSDYINANYCDGYRRSNAYIATQGPLPETFTDFWRMVWEQNSRTIVMMTKLEERTRIKCDQYWPARGSENYGPVQVALQDTQDLATYCIRTFNIQKKQFDEADSNKEGIATRKKHSRRSDRVRGEEFVKNVKEKIDGNPGKSMRAIAKEMDVGSMTIVRTIHEDLGLKSYALRKGQLLTENMKNNRKGKAATLLNNLKHDSFGMLRFFSDEKNFDVDQKVNPRNDLWICKDPSEIPVVMHMKFPASVMVLGVISSEGDVMPPHFFEKGLRMNADTYINVLETVVKPWMDMVAAGRKRFMCQELVTLYIWIDVLQLGHVDKRDIRQFQFTAWPDHGVPAHPTPFLMFLRRIRALNPPEAGPMIVHCSAGVGRTGCFVVIDSMLERLKHETTVDIYGHVTCLRAQRNYMVQTEDQYLFIHEAVLEAVMAGSTEVPAGSLFTHLQMLRNTVPGEGCSGLSLEFKKLALMKTEPQKFVSANLPVNKPKNRLMNILPYESTRVCLQPIRNLEGSDYINASFIDGYRCRNAYIATQSPLPETTEEMWRMLWEHNSNLVVMLAEGTQYWPSERSHRYLYFVVEPITEYNMPQYILREFKVTDARDGQSRTIRQFHFTDWPEQGVPKSGEGFIEFIGQVHKTKEQFGQEGPITVHCSAGAGRTGVFITLSIVLERMQYEGVVDLFQTVRTLRTQRPGMVQTEEQYHFCYQAALEYLNSFDHYAN
ncbi:PTPRD [Cordylochernes scorpioides]|uniref:PTPRD n=1 Tax=Cordylochernes scorpioides TaxID=51811 RepID=A0ABY6KWW0_9ARAC|nr:PTPRD [Cordylochernes scorpioides]